MSAPIGVHQVELTKRCEDLEASNRHLQETICKLKTDLDAANTKYSTKLHLQINCLADLLNKAMDREEADAKTLKDDLYWSLHRGFQMTRDEIALRFVEIFMRTEIEAIYNKQIKGNGLDAPKMIRSSFAMAEMFIEESVRRDAKEESK